MTTKAAAQGQSRGQMGRDLGKLLHSKRMRCNDEREDRELWLSLLKLLGLLKLLLVASKCVMRVISCFSLLSGEEEEGDDDIIVVLVVVVVSEMT